MYTLKYVLVRTRLSGTITLFWLQAP
eukprot:COSAG02_NODE_33344_length_501_cov_1.273632_1_plen_25_part_01